MKLTHKILLTALVSITISSAGNAGNTMQLVRTSADRVEIRLELSEEIAGFQFSLIANEGVSIQGFEFGSTFTSATWMTGSRLANDTILNALAMLMTNRVSLSAGSWVLGSFRVEVVDRGVRGVEIGFAKALIANQQAKALELTSMGISKDLQAWLAADQPDAPKFALMPAYPNPFNPSTQLQYTLYFPAQVNISVYDILGRLVAPLVDEQVQEGTFNVVWDGRNANGTVVASGIYFIAVRVDDQMKVERVAMKK